MIDILPKKSNAADLRKNISIQLSRKNLNIAAIKLLKNGRCRERQVPVKATFK